MGQTVEIVYRYDGENPQVRSRPASTEAALLRLQEGNRAFADLLNNVKDGEGSVRHVIDVDARDFGLLPGADAAPSQRPFAAILGCSDARVPLELIFNEGPNDLFVVRAAGNGVGQRCARQPAIRRRSFGRQPQDYRGPRTQRVRCRFGSGGCVLKSGRLPVTCHGSFSPWDSGPFAGRRSGFGTQAGVGLRSRCRASGGYRSALVEAAIITNAAWSAHEIQQAFAADGQSGVQVAYGVYLLESRDVWTPQTDQQFGTRLAAPPKDAAGFGRLGDAVMRSSRIAGLLAV